MAKARYGSLQGAVATAHVRVRPTDLLRVIPATEFVGIGRHFVGIEGHVALRCPCCDATDVDTRHARICARADAQVNQHQLLLHAISRALKRLGVPDQVQSGEPFTSDTNLRMDIVARRAGLRNAPKPGIEGQVHSSRCDPCRPASTGTRASKQR